MTRQTDASEPSKPKILAVDDDPDGLRILVRHLQKSDFDVMTASSGRETMDMVRRFHPDVLLLDVMMPGMSGMDVCRALRKDPEYRDIYIILLTALTETRDKVQGLDAGAQDYITKPFDPEEFNARVRAGIRIKTLQDEVSRQYLELRRCQAELIQRAKMAATGRLAAGVAHEFNNLLCSMIGYSELALQSNKAEAFQNACRVTLEAGKYAKDLVSNLLSFVRTPDHSPRPVDLGKLVREVMSLSKTLIRMKNIDLHMDIHAAPPVCVDASSIKECFNNVLQNALEALPDAGGRIRIHVAPCKEGVCITCEDNGVGISEENLERVFEPFFTTKGVLGGGEDSRHGMGLGLYVLRGVVEKHGGAIQMESALGRGTSVRITLPFTA